MPRTALATLVALLLLAAPAAAKLPALAVDNDPARGGRVVDVHGREVLLRGVELSLDTADLRVLQATGWNLVRVRVSLDPATLARAERVVDALGDAGLYSVIALPELPAGLTSIASVVTPFANRPHVAGFEGVPVAGKLLFNPVLAAGAPLVLTPAVASPGGLQAARDAGRGAPVLVSWRAGGDAVQMQDAQSGLRLGSIAEQPGRIDPRGPLARAYVRAAPGRLAFTHYEDRRGHFAARGEAPRGTRVPVEIFYPQAKHAGARMKAKGLRDVRAHRLAGGGRLIWGTPTGRWSLQIGPHVKK